jgi:hypothetical protein
VEAEAAAAAAAPVGSEWESRDDLLDALSLALSQTGVIGLRTVEKRIVDTGHALKLGY